MKEDIVFIHDATPTWSGFIYQGYVACYLVLKEINEQRKKAVLSLDEIGRYYKVELENCEDVAILCADTGKYLSIHQVKNEKASKINEYRSPIVQLMLERGYWMEKGKGFPEAYLHVSNRITDIDLKNRINEWRQEIQDFYKKLEPIHNSLFKNYDEQQIEKLKEILEQEPLKLNRAEYKNNIKELKRLCGEETENHSEILKVLSEICSFLKEKLCVNSINKDVKIYAYDNGKMYASADELLDNIKECIREYKKDDIDKSAVLQIEYIANKILEFMRKHVIERHEAQKQKKKICKSIPFSKFIEILNVSLADYAQEGNMLVLKGIYERRMAEYCKNRCKKDSLCCECKISDSKFMKLTLPDTEFVKFCYCLNPDCEESLQHQSSLNGLLNQDGLKECVFEIVKEISEERFLLHGNKERFMIDNQNKNALVSAISNNCEKDVVEHITNGINNNSDNVSSIFDADQIITTRLDASSEAWECSFTDIEAVWKQAHSSEQENCFMPKKPEFVSVKQILR